MKAIAREEYGAFLDVLALKDVERPRIKPDEVLVDVRVASLNAGDVAVVRGTPYLIRLTYGLMKPREAVIGQDVAGTVVEVGSQVHRFAPGDEVFGGGFGTFAEYARAPEKRLAVKPTAVSFETAAAIPIAGLTALQGIRDRAGVTAGQRVLINGASGGVGTYAVQIAKALGAEVTAVCSTANVEQAQALGANLVIDYTRDDFTRRAELYDVVFDNAASHPLQATISVLDDGGVLIPNAGKLDSRWLASVPRMLGAVSLSLFGDTTARLHAQTWRSADLVTLAEMVESGALTPAIDRTYPLVEVAEALSYMGEGHARGKVVITV